MSKNNTFIKTSESSLSLRLDFIIALVPALIWSFVRFGTDALITVLLSVATAAATDVLLYFFKNLKFRAPSLYSIYCGMIFGAMLYAQTHILLTILGSVLCILLIYIMGGEGKCFLFAPVVARFLIFCLLPYRINKPDKLPLEVLFNGELPKETVYDLVLGMSQNIVGAVSALAMIFAIIYLWIRKACDFKSSFAYIACSFALSFAFPAFQGRGVESAIFELLAGEILFAAAFILTDFSSSPKSVSLKFIQGAVCALITFALRQIGYATDSVFLAVLCTNMISHIVSEVIYVIREVKNEK